MFDRGRSPKVGEMRVIPNSRKKYLKNKLGPLYGVFAIYFIVNQYEMQHASTGCSIWMSVAEITLDAKYRLQATSSTQIFSYLFGHFDIVQK